MIFLGDIACPDVRVVAFNNAVDKCKCFENEVIVLNLEATIAADDQSFSEETLFNSKHVLDAFLRKGRKVIVSLANNHMYDYPERIQPTIDYLHGKGIGTFGICENDGSYVPYVYEESDVKHAFFGHCWRLYTETNKNKVNDVRVVDYPYDEFIETVTNYMRIHLDTKVYCFMHWNYDLEKLPFPLHLNVARRLIDNGATAIIGSHSHRPQAAEIYKGKPIVYGLGNFYLPSKLFFSGKLSYPDVSKDTYALVLKDDKAKVQWFRTDSPPHSEVPIVECEAESFNGKRISKISEGVELPIRKYVSYFRKHRLKKLLVPVFVEIAGFIPRMKEELAILRVRILRKIK